MIGVTVPKRGICDMWQRLAAGALALMMPAIAWAALDGQPEGELPAPSGPVILTVSGDIENANSEQSFRFDRAMLEAVGVTTLRTTTSWTSGVVEFEGVLARDILDTVGAEGEEVLATALNDYVVRLSLEELYRYPVMLAFKMNGEYLQIRDKGPIWLVFPRDQFPELRNSVTDKKWVWQLRELEVK